MPIVFGKKKDIKADTEERKAKLRAQLDEADKELAEIEERNKPTAVIDVADKTVKEPPAIPEIPKGDKALIREITEELAPIFGGALPPADEQALTLALLLGIFRELKRLNS
jgi:molecular chaperone DnaK (HSP70)